MDAEPGREDDGILRRWASSTRRLIAATLRRSPEQRLADLKRASAFYAASRRA